MKQVIFNLYAFIALLFGMLLGLLGAYGACVPIWGAAILETALGPHPDRSHPAFWFSLILLVPSMLLGAAGAVVLFILPVAFRFPTTVKISPRSFHQMLFLRTYAERLLLFIADQEKSQKASPTKSPD